MSLSETPGAASPAAPTPGAADAAAAELTVAEPVATPSTGDAPRYWAWTDRWDPGKWETPENPTPLQRVLAAIALVIVLVMTVYVPLRILNIL